LLPELLCSQANPGTSWVGAGTLHAVYRRHVWELRVCFRFVGKSRLCCSSRHCSPPLFTCLLLSHSTRTPTCHDRGAAAHAQGAAEPPCHVHPIYSFNKLCFRLLPAYIDKSSASCGLLSCATTYTQVHTGMRLDFRTSCCRRMPADLQRSVAWTNVRHTGADYLPADTPHRCHALLRASVGVLTHSTAVVMLCGATNRPPASRPATL